VEGVGNKAVQTKVNVVVSLIDLRDVKVMLGQKVWCCKIYLLLI